MLPLLVHRAVIGTGVVKVLMFVLSSHVGIFVVASVHLMRWIGRIFVGAEVMGFHLGQVMIVDVVLNMLGQGKLLLGLRCACQKYDCNLCLHLN